MAYLIAYLVCALVMGGLDFLWLSNTSAPLYHRDLGPLLAENPNMTVAVIFYLGYAAVLCFLPCGLPWPPAFGGRQSSMARC